MTVEHELPILSYEDAIGFMGSPELFVEIGEMLLEELPELMDKIHSYFAAGELLEVSRTAHRVKGNFGVIAAERAQDAAKDLEYTSRDGDRAGAESALVRLEAAIEQVVPEIEKVIAEAAA